MTTILMGVRHDVVHVFLSPPYKIIMGSNQLPLPMFLNQIISILIYFSDGSSTIYNRRFRLDSFSTPRLRWVFHAGTSVRLLLPSA